MRAAETAVNLATLVCIWRRRLLGNPPEKMQCTQVVSGIPEDLGPYLAYTAAFGVPTRRNVPRWRLRAKPHQSAREHLLQLYASVWKDSKHGGCSG